MYISEGDLDEIAKAGKTEPNCTFLQMSLVFNVERKCRDPHSILSIVLFLSSRQVENSW